MKPLSSATVAQRKEGAQSTTDRKKLKELLLQMTSIFDNVEAMRERDFV